MILLVWTIWFSFLLFLLSNGLSSPTLSIPLHYPFQGQIKVSGRESKQYGFSMILLVWTIWFSFLLFLLTNGLSSPTLSIPLHYPFQGQIKVSGREDWLGVRADGGASQQPRQASAP